MKIAGHFLTAFCAFPFRKAMALLVLIPSLLMSHNPLPLSPSLKLKPFMGIENCEFKLNEHINLSQVMMAEDSKGNLYMGKKGASIDSAYTFSIPMRVYGICGEIELLSGDFLNFKLCYQVAQKRLNKYEKNTSYNGHLLQLPSGKELSFSSLSRENPQLYPRTQGSFVKNKPRVYSFEMERGRELNIGDQWLFRYGIGYYFERIRFSYSPNMPFQSINSQGPLLNFSLRSNQEHPISFEFFNHFKFCNTQFGHFSSRFFPSSLSPQMEWGIKMHFNKTPLTLSLSWKYAHTKNIQVKKKAFVMDNALIKPLPITHTYNLQRRSSKLLLSLEWEL